MGKKQSSNDDFPEALKPFRFHGVFTRTGPYLRSGRDWIGECPFCGKRKSFAVNRDNGQWSCHSKPQDCGRSGNIPTFLHQFAEDTHKHTRPALWTELSRLRKKIPVEAFKQWGVGWDYKLKRWVVPVRAKDGGIVDLRVYSPKTGKKMGTAGRSAGCWNLAGAAEVAGPDVVLFICEGEWDGMALHWLLDQLGLDYKWAVIALPGARTVKDEWISVVKKFGRVVTMGDNDGDGDAMAEKIWSKLMANGFRGKLQFLNWPDTLPEGHDVTDQIGAGLAVKLLKRRVWKSLQRLIDNEHRRQPFKGEDNITAAKGGRRAVEVERPATNPSFMDTVKVYEKHLKMTNHHIMALQYCYSIYLSTQWDDDPLWGFLVGVPGSGKTELLVSMDGSPEAIYYSSLQSKGLVSGFQCDPDPSLIPEMIGRCSIFKDFTELLKGNEDLRNETFDVLRGWYDGHVKRKFGNGVEREYVGRGNVIGGVTNVIHSQNDSTLGERFIKFQMPKPKKKVADEIVMRAILNTAQEEKKNEELRAAANAFLNRKVPHLVPGEVIPMKFLLRIRALANLVSFMRAKVDWSGYGYDKELAHRPEAELPTRLGKQLTKLCMANMVVMDKKKADEDVFRLVERVAFNTAHGFHLDIVQAAMEQDGKNLMVDDLVEGARMPKETLKHRLDDLYTLNLINKTAMRSGVAGRPHTRYTLVRSIRDLWREADVKEDHVGDIVDARRTRDGWNETEDN